MTAQRNTIPFHNFRHQQDQSTVAGILDLQVLYAYTQWPGLPIWYVYHPLYWLVYRVLHIMISRQQFLKQPRIFLMGNPLRPLMVESLILLATSKFSNVMPVKTS